MLPSDEKIFSKLDEKLNEKGIQLSIICVGGYVLKYHGIRETMDIDAFFTNTHEIQSIIKSVGDELSINSTDEDWLNASVQNLNEIPDKDICSTIYEGQCLKVMIPPLMYVAGMKLASEREIDILDVAQIISTLHKKNPNSFRKELMEYGYGFVDEALILEAFSEAYGIEWLEKYYNSNEKEIIDNLDFLSSGSYDSSVNKSIFGYGKEHTIKNFELRKDFIKIREKLMDQILKIPTTKGREEAFIQEMRKRLREKYSYDEVTEAFHETGYGKDDTPPLPPR